MSMRARFVSSVLLAAVTAHAQCALVHAHPAPPYPRAIGWEPNTGKGFLVGGSGNTIWRFDDGLWTPVHTATAMSLTAQPYVCTWPGHGMLLVGGTPTQTWLFDGVDWSRIFTANTPAAVRALAFDVARNFAVAVVDPGGSTPVSSQLWEFDGVDWLQRPLSSSPPRLTYMDMAWDSALQRCVLRISNGGWGNATGIYSWNGASWTTHSIGGSGLIGFAMATAPSPTGGILYSGGFTQPFYAGTSFVSWLTGWVDLEGASAPPVSMRSWSWYDPTLNRTYVMSHGTWYWDGSAWSRPANGVRIPAGIRGFVYDSWRGRALGYGSGILYSHQRNDLWQLRNLVPTLLGSGPPARLHHAMAFDSLRGKLVVCGGASWDPGGGHYTYLGDSLTWEFDGTSWTAVPPTTAPAPTDPRFRVHAAMCFDRTRGKAVLFGGTSIWGISTTAHNDTYEWDGSTWTPMQPTVVPPAGGLMDFDAGLGKCVLWSGTTAWAWDGTNWTSLGLPLPPGYPRYDVSRGLWVVLATYPHIAWELHNGAWQPVGPTATTSYPISTNAPMAFDLGQGAFAGSDHGAFTYGDVAAATLRPFGDGCAGPAGAPVLHGEDAPRLGRTVTLRVARAPAGAPIVGLFGVDATSWLGATLPIDLGPIGMPGCSLHTPIDLSVLLAGTTLPIAIPNNASLLGNRYRCQALVVDLAANALGLTTSNGVAIRIGA